nr:hypothetical protein [Tanacetum cinerariifolium]
VKQEEAKITAWENPQQPKGNMSKCSYAGSRSQDMDCSFNKRLHKQGAKKGRC